MNSAESAALELVLRERGWEKAPSGEKADLVLLNTCSVRHTAETRLKGRLAHYEALKKALADNRVPAFTLIVAGCMASRLGAELKSAYPAIDQVMGTNARSIFPAILEAVEQGRPFEPASETPVFSFSSSHLEAGAFRSFVPIMHGCNNFCSYCIVPYVRGREVSRSPASIETELQLLAEKGVREITLLGQNVNSYHYSYSENPDSNGGRSKTGPDGLDFPGLLTFIARRVKDTSIEWVHFLSANPGDLSPETIAVMAENRCFCRHLHLPVQHGSNRILAAMNRRYTREHFLTLAAELRKAIPGISLSTDILVGFPGETEEDLEATLNLMKEIRFLYAYMYYYNPREGTAACDLPNQVPEETKLERLGRVIALQNKVTEESLLARVGSRERVLIEGISRKNADELIARTEKDEMAVLGGPKERIGSFAEVKLHSLKGRTFRAAFI